jgi:hypothetical protein
MERDDDYVTDVVDALEEHFRRTSFTDEALLPSWVTY